MNKIYKLIWNKLTSSWIAVAEFVRAQGKKSAIIVMAISISHRLNYFIPESLAGPISPPPQNQLPTQGLVVRGNVSINESPNVMQINQDSTKAILNWGTFNIGSAATVNFNQPSPSAVILNNILDANPSQIYGHINANGQVFFSNPNGMYFSPTSSVSVGGLVATINSISNDDFMVGRFNFYRNNATGSIINEGKLAANLGGYIALLAPEVRNQGIVIAQLGSVIMAAGETYTLEFKNDTSLTNVYVSASALNTLISNGQAIYAPGGLVILSAKAANQIQGGVINNTGLIEASSLTDHGGIIRLEASKEINQSGSIKANAAPSSIANGGKITLIADLTNNASFVKIAGKISAEGGNLGGNGGFIETSGSKVKIEDGALISTAAPLGKNGEWLLDPVNFLVASSGGDITGSQLSTLLNSNSVTLQTNTGTNTSTNRYGVSGSDGNITVNDSITWNAHNLTLSAANSIYINSPLYGAGSASLSLQYGQASSNGGDSNYFINAPVNLPTGNNFTTQKGTTGSLITYQVINDLNALQAITSSGNYALGSNIDASATSTWNSGAGFAPLTLSTNQRFDGLGHTINYITITPNYPLNQVGLFQKTTSTASINNLNINNAYVSSVNSIFDITDFINSGTGALIGLNHGTVNNVHINNSFVEGRFNTGGIIGYNTGLLNNSSFSGNIGSTIDLENYTYLVNTGGLIGYNTGSINNSYVIGNVNGTIKVGGLVGNNFGGSITNTHINGDVSGGFKVGGLAGSDGFSLQNAIEPCLDVECIDPGNIISTGGVIQNSYINGNVTGSLKVGGLTSLNIGEISSSQIRGNVTGDTKVGGLTALNLNSIYNSNINGNVIGSYWVGGLTATNFGSIDSSYIRGNVSGDGKVGTLSALNFGSITNSYQYSPSQEQPIPQDIALSDIDNLLKKKIPKKINSDELINYEAIRSNIIVRAKVIIH